jgi:pyruvate,water dikinase
VCEDGFLELVAGRIYADPDRLAEIFCAGLPVGYDLNALQADPRWLERGPATLAPERADAWLLFRLPALIWTMWRGSRQVKRASARVVERFEQQALPPYLSHVQQQRHVDLTRLSDSELTALLEERCTQVLDEFAAESLRPAFFAALAMHALESRLVRLMGAEEGGRCARDLVLGLAEPPTAACEAGLYRLAQGQVSVEEFLEQFGHRGPGEMELAAPRWREIPDQLERLAAWLRDTKAADPETLRQRAAAERELAWQALPQRLAEHGASSFAAAVQREARQAQQLLPYRESARHTFLLGYELIRQAVQEIGRRLELGEDVFFLRYDELFAPQSWREVIHRRRQRWQLLQRLAVPEAVDPAHLEVIGAAPRQSAAVGVRMEATAVSAGTARGPVRIWTAARPVYDMPAGSVLVCASLDTGLTPLLLRAAAVVVERGGLLSHGAIVARQLGIPAVVLAGARELLRDGQVVVVDGDHGCLFCDGEPAP